MGILCHCHEFAVHLRGKHQLDELGPELRRFAHRHPNISVQEVATIDSSFDILCQHDKRSGLLGHSTYLLNTSLARPALFRTSQTNIHAHLRSTEHQGFAYVVTNITEKAE